MIVILDSVKFQKNYFDNRCRIKQDGAAQWLTVPVQHRDAGLPIESVLICDDRPWEKKAWAALEGNYQEAPFWAEHEPFLKALFEPGRWKRIVDLNMEFIAYACRYLEIPLNWRYSSALGVQTKGSQLVLDLCKAVGADSYLSGAFGKGYLDESAFQAANITLHYQAFYCPEYTQFNGPYVGPLSILDMLLNQGRKSRELLA